MKNDSKLEQRAKIVNYIYYYELMGQELNSERAFTSGDFNEKEIKTIDGIATNYSKFKKLIIKFVKTGWDWNRLSPFVRAILIYGSFDFLFNDKNLVINEMVKLTQAYSPDEAYKLVNGILDKVGDYYEKIKSNKKAA